MTGYSMIKKIIRLDSQLAELGLILCDANTYTMRNTGVCASMSPSADLVAVSPRDEESFPLFSPTAMLFIGTIEETELWLRGVMWSRDCDRMLFGSAHDSRREKKMQDRRNQRLIERLKNTGVSEKKE